MAVPSFRIKALCDLHGVDEGARQEVISKIGKLKDPIITCKQIEDVIVNMTATYVDSPNKKQKLVRTLHHKRYFNILDGGQYRWVTTMIAKQQFCGKTKTYADIDAISIQPVSVQALSAAEREFGSDRLLFVTFMDVTDMKYLDEVISKMNKIQFGGQSFHFLGGKVNDKKSIRNDTSMMPSNVFDSKSFVAWYVAIQGNDTQSSWDHCNTGNRGPKLHVPNLQEVRLWYGQFPAGTLPSKINARLQLAFTSSHQSSLQVSSFVVTVEPDIYSPDGNIMTDGCGFISAELMIFIPKVSNGQRVLSETCDNDLIFRKPEDRLPTCIQVRMIGKMGLFKGLLIVTNDKSLCPAGTIKFRESMRKSQPTTDYIDRTGSTHDNYLLIKNTFEGKQPRFARTSDRLILMLTQCGVPLAYFEQMMQKEVERVLVAPSSKKGVLTLLQSFLGRQKDGIVSSSAASIAVSGVLIPDDPRDEYDEIEYDDNDETTIEDWDDEDDSRSVITGYFNNVNKNVEVRNGRSVNQKRAEAALSFLLTDHELDEGQFLSHIRYLQTQQLQRLWKFKLRFNESLYCMGHPDSYNTLLPGEVFVLLPESIGRQVLQGPVLVTRNPIIHPSDIRKLKAVRNAKLNDLYKNSLGGCIVFATQGDRSAADEMSGGDFDGDTYLVIFTNDELMDKFQPILEPFDYSIPMEPEPTPKVPVRVPVPPFSSNPSPNPKQTHPNNIYSIPQPIPKTPAKPPSVAVIPSPYYRQPEAPPAMTLTQELNLEDTINAELGYRAPAVKPPVSSAAKMSARSNVEKHSTVDSISFAIMKELITSVQGQSLGKYFNGWAAHAFDPSFGPKHPISEKLARVSCALLDASKTGFDAATMHLDKYLRKPLPYHLLAKDKRETAESSLSSLDRLTLLIKQAETSLTISENLGHHELDEDYQLVAGESDPLYPLRSKYLLKWKDRCDEYFESKKEIVISKENKQNSNKYDELRIKYRNLFDIDRAVIFAELLKLRRIEYNPAERKSVFIYNIEREASHFLAAIVYEVTYLKYFSRLTFCWEVCGRELHSLKDSVNKRKRDEAIMSAPGDRDDSVYCPLAPSIESLLV